MGNNTYLIEYAINTVANRNKFCTLAEFKDVLNKNKGREIYRSMFLYEPDEIKKHHAEHGTVARYNGKQAIDKLYIDVDLEGQKQGDATINKVGELVDDIQNLGVKHEHINVWFSGRGFHIHLPDIYGFKAGSSIAAQVKATMQRDFAKYIDNIYDNTRLIRASYSLNKKSNRYKVPLPLSAVTSNKWSYNYVLDFAKTNSKMYAHKKLPDEVSELYPNLLPHIPSEKNEKITKAIFTNVKYKPTKHITCIQHMYNAGYVHGHRHKHLLRLASLWITKFGFPKEAVMSMARTWNNSLTQPLPNEEVSSVLRSITTKDGYNYSCRDEVLSRYCDSKCTLYKYKDLDDNVAAVNSSQMAQILLEAYTEDFTNRSFNIKDIFPFMTQDYVVKCGELVVLTGDTKLGKTAFWQYIIANIDIPTLFLSLEVQAKLMARRFYQIALGKSKEQIEDMFIAGNTEVIEEAVNKLSHLEIIDASVAPDVSQYAEMVDKHDVKIIVVDTLDVVQAKFAKKEPLQQQIYIINALKNLAVEKDIIVLAVNHLSKTASYRHKEGEELDVYSAKGASDVAQKSDKMIAFMGNKQSKKRKIKSLASRDESDFEIVTAFDWKTFSFSKYA